jgi:hypothetical protein
MIIRNHLNHIYIERWDVQQFFAADNIFDASCHLIGIVTSASSMVCSFARKVMDTT